MKSKLLLTGILLLFGEVIGPPVTQQKKKDGEGEKSENQIENDEQLGTGALGIEYDRYLKEVVTALESDPEFREKLEKAEEVDIRTGKIAQELEYVSHNVRSKLDELKRQELERLRQLAGQDPHHLDHKNPHTFEVEDLKKLIAKTTADLAEADRKRRQEFKEYEMQKQFEKEQRLQAAPEGQRHELEEQEQKLQEKHKKHEPLHHPGSKQQLEEVWEKQDHMENQDFDPKTFFYLHDLDGNGVWDEEEVKALFLKELDKLYQAGAPEDDMRERREEMERMREHVFKEADINKDGLISFQEFLQQTQKPDFEKDEGWQGLDEQQLYSPDEYVAFEQRRQQEIQRMIQQGLIPPHPNGLPPPPLSVGHQQFQQPQHFPAGQMHPNQIPQASAGQFHQGQPHPGQMPQGQFHPGQVSQGQFHPGQAAQAPYHPAAVPQGQFQHGQVPQAQYHPGQVPQGQFHPGQVPQAQFHPQAPQQPPLQHGQVPGQGHINTGAPQAPVDAQHSQSPPQPNMQQTQQQQQPQQQPQQQQQQPQQQKKLEVPSPNQSQTSHQEPGLPNLPVNHVDTAFGQHPPQPIKELHEPIDLKPNSQG